MTMEEALEQVQRKDTKERLVGIERLQKFVDHNQKNLSEKEIINLVDASTALLKDNNFKVCQGTLHLLTLVAAMSREYLKVHVNQLVPTIVERLGDSKQIIRDASRRLLLVLMEVSTPSIVANRAGSYAWTHKNWRVREEFTHTIASAFNLFSAIDLPFQQAHLPAVLQLLKDSNNNVREAALLCLEEIYRHGGQNIKGELQYYHLHPTQMKEISSRFDKIEPVQQLINDPPTTNGSSCNSQQNPCHKLSIQYGISNGVELSNQHPNLELKVAHLERNQRQLSPHRQCGSDDKPIDPIEVFSERELTKEFEKIASLLKVDQDWSIRMAAMQKLEGIIVGGAIEYPCFLTLFKHFVSPFNIQLLDRRSSIVKQACQLLIILSQRFGISFEFFAEAFIPVLFKSVVITVLVIAESADNCIKTMLKNCCVARLLPRILECAKHDQNAILRGRCCEYALLVLEKWGDSPKLHRAPDLYRELIRCCSLDGVGEVRSFARACYRVYSRLWPNQALQLYSLFDPAVQKVLHGEDIIDRQYMSPPMRDQNTQPRQSSKLLIHSKHALEGKTLYEWNKNMTSNPKFANLSNPLQRKAFDMSSKKKLQKMLQASHLKAIEKMLKGINTSDLVVYEPNHIVGGSYREIHASAFAETKHITIDSPSARDPLHPASAQDPPHFAFAPAICHHNLQEPNLQQFEHNNIIGLSATMQVYSDIETSKEGENEEGYNLETHSIVPSTSNGDIALGFHGAKQIVSCIDISSKSNISKKIILDIKTKRTPIFDSYIEKLNIPGLSSSFETLPQKLNLKYTSLRRSLESNILEENHQQRRMNLQREMSNYMDGVMSLNDVLNEGLEIHADWSARVAAFTYIQRLLQHNSKGLHEVTQNFEQVMKLFSEHLDNPHWKVTQAALFALIELVPTCRRMFELYLERTLPSVFARLVDNKDTIRRLGLLALETIGDTYSIDTLLLPLLRSFDEQRISKAKMAVIEFAISAFAKLATDNFGTSSVGLLKLWLGKLAPLANDKNAKLRETAIAGIIFVYSQFDPIIVLNFILGLSIEDQSMLRRALKQFTPRIDLDLMTYLHNKIQRPRIKPVSNQVDSTLSQVEDLTSKALITSLNNDLQIGGYSTSLALEGDYKQTINQVDRTSMYCFGHQTPSLNDLKQPTPPQDSQVLEDVGVTLECNKSKGLCNGVSGSHDSYILQSFQAQFKDYHMSNGKFNNKSSIDFNVQNLQASMEKNFDLKKNDETPLEGHKTYIDAYLQKSPNYKFSEVLHCNESNDHDFYHQLQGSFKDLGGYQQTSYSNLYSHLPTK